MMGMAHTTNPRKIGETSGMVYVSLPKDLLEAASLEPGDRVVLESTQYGFIAEKVEFQRASDV